MNFKQSQKTDADEIRCLFVTTFSDSESEEDGILVGDLAYQLVTKTDERDVFGFVAEDNGEIIGCIAFSRLRFEDETNAFILAPVAVQSGHQGRGIGQQLITFGINHMRDKGVDLVITYGDPNFYSKVGFVPVVVETIPAPLELSQPEGWLCQSLVKDTIVPISGSSSCVRALNKPEYW